ncbi:MAG: hypothetical protein JSW67_06640 [Candidatus Latescibacterota bacterium]|nr:MAG: hypothetical protein JSW67_06640 [Candidatus Latescibacterota bacterium]
MRRRLLALISFERGALLWVPALWLAAAALLFAILQATSEEALYNHARELRVAIGPLRGTGLSASAREEFAAGLRAGLAAQRELTLVAEESVQRRLRAVLGAAAPPDPQRWMRATRNLNVRYWLHPVLMRAGLQFDGSLSVWEVAPEREVHSVRAVEKDLNRLGRVLADSIGVVLFRPRPLTPES